MKQYKKNYELKNAAKDKLAGRYGGAVLIVFLSSLISWAADLLINVVASATMGTMYVSTGSVAAANAVSYVFDGFLLLVSIVLGVMNAGIALYFLNIACGRPCSVRDLFYGFRTDSRKALVIAGAFVVLQSVTLLPGQYLAQNYLTTHEGRWLLYALPALAVGWCIYIPVSLGIALSFYLMLDFPQNSGVETLSLCRRVMKGQKGRLFYLEVSFLPLMLLGVLSFGIGFLWIEPYMQMTYTYFFLDLMNPKGSD